MRTNYQQAVKNRAAFTFSYTKIRNHPDRQRPQSRKISHDLIGPKGYREKDLIREYPKWQQFEVECSPEENAKWNETYKDLLGQQRP